MSVPVLPFENNHKLAHALGEKLAILGAPSYLALRPFNRFSSALTTWWLVPGKEEWPAYHCSKLVLYPFDDAPGGATLLLAGLQIEKGVSPKLAGLPELRPATIMREHWRWHSLARRDFVSTLSSLSGKVASLSLQPVVLMLDAYQFNRVPEPDKPTRAPDDRALWLFDPTSLALVTTSPPTGDLGTLGDPSTLTGLVGSLLSNEPLEYFWLNLRVGIYAVLSTECGPSPAWDATELWKSALEPWLPALA